MSILDKLATALERRDETPNIEVARQIAAKNDKGAVKELIENLSNKKKDIQHDCIKALYETAYIKPALISPFIKHFLDLLSSKNNRMQWGAMIALGAITKEDPSAIYKALPKIMDASGKGSVITKDHAYKILCRLCEEKTYSVKVFPLMIEHLLKSPANQLPSYAEQTFPFITDKNKAVFLKTLSLRLKDMESDTKRKRVEKIIKKLEK
jgi:hypothetical protein